MIIRSISICLRCQKGGEPASSVYMITPVLHLQGPRRTHQLQQHPKDPYPTLEAMGCKGQPGTLGLRLQQLHGDMGASRVCCLPGQPPAAPWNIFFFLNALFNSLQTLKLVPMRSNSCCASNNLILQAPQGLRAPHSHVHFFPIALVFIIHGAVQDFGGQVARCTTDFCKTGAEHPLRDDCVTLKQLVLERQQDVFRSLQ